MLTLKNRADFQRVQRGTKWVSAAFILQGIGQSPLPGGADTDIVQELPRFGFTVSSRAVAKERAGQKRRGMAVARNRARRRLKEAVRLTAPDAAAPGFDYVIIGRPAALTRNFAQLLADMRLAFHKIGQKIKSAGLPERAGKRERGEAVNVL